MSEKEIKTYYYTFEARRRLMSHICWGQSRVISSQLRRCLTSRYFILTLIPHVTSHILVSKIVKEGIAKCQIPSELLPLINVRNPPSNVNSLDSGGTEIKGNLKKLGTNTNPMAP